MKFRSWALYLAVLSAGGCGPISEKEPNDHFTVAQPISANSKIHGTISSPSDVDVYRLQITADTGVLDVRVGGIREVDFALSVQDQDRAELKTLDETGAGGDEKALDIGLRAGSYYIVISNKNSKAGNSQQAYLLETSLREAANNELEPNDSALRATPIVPGSVVRGHYHPTHNPAAVMLSSGATDQALIVSSSSAQEPPGPGSEPPGPGSEPPGPGSGPPAPEVQPEEDWFKVSVNSLGMNLLNVDVSEVPNVDPILEVYDINSYKIRELDAGGPGEGERLRNFGVRGPVEYFLRLRAKSKYSGNPEVRYELLTELIPYSGSTEFEPNDQRADATLFEKGTITGGLSPAGDLDWYKVSVQDEGKQILSANVTGVAGMDLVLSVTDDLGKPLAVIDNGGKEQPEALTGMGVTKGEVFLVVSGKSGKKSDPKQAYALTKSLSIFQPGLEYEINDSTALAQVLKVGDSVDGYAAPKGDVDFYQFNVYQNGATIFEITGVLNVRLSMTLYDQEYKELQSIQGKKSGEALDFSRPLDPGTYFIQIKAEDSGQNNVRDKYTLRLRAQ